MYIPSPGLASLTASRTQARSEPLEQSTPNELSVDTSSPHGSKLSYESHEVMV